MKKISNLVLLLILFMVVDVLSQNISGNQSTQNIYNAYQRGEISYKEFLVGSGYLIYSREKFREEFPQYVPVQYNKSGTTIVAEIKNNWDLFSPEEQSFFEENFKIPQLDYTYDSPSGFFRIHYSTFGTHKVSTVDANQNDISDYIEEMGYYFDYSLEYATKTLRFNPPPIDSTDGNTKYHIYVRDLSSGTYGITHFNDYIPGNDNNARYSHIEIENDFREDFYTKGINAVKVTSAHELNHGIQVGYIDKSYEYYFYEVTSVWVEESTYPDVNDYFQYLYHFYNQIDKPFNTRDHLHEYGLGLWGIFLEKKYGPKVMSKTWEYFINSKSYRALDKALQEYDTSFDEELAEFYSYLVLTGDNADENIYFDDASEFPVIDASFFNLRFTSEADTSFIINSNFLSSHYIRVSSTEPVEYNIEGIVKENAEGYFINKAVFYNGIDFSLRNINFLNSTISTGYFSTIYPNSYLILIPVCIAEIYNVNSDDKKYTQRINLYFTKGSQKPENKIFASVPNPFIMGNSENVNIPFLLVEDNEVEIFIYNSAGQLIKDFYLGLLTAGNYKDKVTWNGRDNNDNLVSSGIYISVLKVGKKIYKNKLAVIRR